MTMKDAKYLDVMQGIVEENEVAIPMPLKDMVKLEKVVLLELYVLALVSRETLVCQLKDAWDTIERLKHNQL